MSKNKSRKVDVSKDLPEDLRQAIEDLPPKKQNVIISGIQAYYYRGQLPDPASLERFDQIIPNGAERIFDRFEKQSDHRMYLEKKVIESQIKDGQRGQVFGFIIAILFLIGSIYLAMNGFETVASVLGGTTVVGLVTAFIYGKKSQRKELQEKA